MADVHIQNIDKYYGDLQVLHDVSLDIADGEFVILVGPSGCGKSTLLRMIAGLEPITDGDIAIGSKVVNTVAPKHRNIAMVFQSYALYPHKTVAQNMGFALLLAKTPKAEIVAKVKAAAEILDLTHLLERYPKALSGGQRQRVAMGRAIVRDPHVFLFDEPLSNLDAKLRVQMRTEIKSLHKRLKTTTIYVTHDQVEAMTMADRIVVMNKGKIEQAGRPLDLYDKPENLFVAGFLGSPAMNFLSGYVDGKNFVSEGGTRIKLKLEHTDISPSRKLVLGIRPEHIRITPRGKSAIVIVDEPTGAETLVMLSVGSDKIYATFRERMVMNAGQSLKIEFPANHIHLFDHASGLRVRPSVKGL